MRPHRAQNATLAAVQQEGQTAALPVLQALQAQRLRTALLELARRGLVSGPPAKSGRGSGWMFLVPLLAYFGPQLFKTLSSLGGGTPFDWKSLLWPLGLLAFLLIEGLINLLVERRAASLGADARLLPAVIESTLDNPALLAATPPLVRRMRGARRGANDADRLWLALGAWPWLKQPSGHNLTAADLLQGLSQLLFALGMLAVSLMIGWSMLAGFMGQLPVPNPLLPYLWPAISVFALGQLGLRFIDLPRRRGRDLLAGELKQALSAHFGCHVDDLLIAPLRARLGEALLLENRSAFWIMWLLPLAGAIALGQVSAQTLSYEAPSLKASIAFWTTLGGVLALVPAWQIVARWREELRGQLRASGLALQVAIDAEAYSARPRPTSSGFGGIRLDQLPSGSLEAEIFRAGRELPKRFEPARLRLPGLALSGIGVLLLCTVCGFLALHPALSGWTYDYSPLGLLAGLLAPGLLSIAMPYGAASAAAVIEFVLYMREGLSSPGDGAQARA